MAPTLRLGSIDFKPTKGAGGEPNAAALAAPSAPVRSTAGRWVKEARRRGLLGEAKRGKAGEHTNERKERP